MTKGWFSKILVAFIIIANVIFTALVLKTFKDTMAEPTTLIVSWFGFTTGELGLMAFIKNKKGGNDNG